MVARGMLKPVYFAFVQTMLEFFLQTTHLVKSRAHSPRPTSKIIAVIALTRAILMKADPVVSLLACSAVAHAHAKKTPVPRTDDFLRTKISWMHRLPNFLTHGTPLRALRSLCPQLARAIRGGHNKRKKALRTAMFKRYINSIIIIIIIIIITRKFYK